MDRFRWRLDGRTENPRLRDGVKSVTGVDNSRADWDLVSFEPFRIASTIPALVMVHNDLGNIFLLGMFRKNLGSLGRVRLDDLVLLRRQLSRLKQDGIRNGNFSQIMKDAPDPDRVAHFIAEMQKPSDCFGHFANSLRMAKGLSVSLVNYTALHDE